MDSWNPDNLVVINLNQGIGGNLGFELPEGNKVYVPSAKHRLKTPFELYLEMQRMRYADGSPLLSGDQSPVFPKDPGEFGYVDPFTGPLVSWWDLLDAMDLTHQDQSARNGSGYQAYDPQRAYMDRGEGGNFSDPNWKPNAYNAALGQCLKKYCGGAPLKLAYDIIERFLRNNATIVFFGMSALELAVSASKVWAGSLIKIALLMFVGYWTYYSPSCVIACSIVFLICKYKESRQSKKQPGDRLI